MSYTKEYVQNQHNELLADNNQKLITEAKMRQVMLLMRDMVKPSTEVMFQNAFLNSDNVAQAITNLAGISVPLWNSGKNYPTNYVVHYDSALWKAKVAIPAGNDPPGTNANWGSMGLALTPAQLSAKLQELIGANRLPKSAVKGGEFALNFRGEGDIYDETWLAEFGYVSPGDFFIARGTDEPTGPYNDGDWMVIMEPQWPIDPMETDDTLYKRLPFGDIETLDLPSQNIDFIAIEGVNHHESDDPFIIEVGDTVRLESRLTLLEAFSKIEWNVVCLDPATILSSNRRDPEFTFSQAGLYQVNLGVANRAGTSLGTKTVIGFIDVQDTSKYYVEFLATDYNSDPVEGVRVEFNGVVKYTLSDGKVKFVNIEAGSYALEATKDGFADVTDAAFAVADNIDNSPLAMVLDGYIENDELTGDNTVGSLITADYDFVPAAYEGATEIKWWVENSEGTVIVPSVTKVRGTDEDYNEFTIPEAAAGHIVKAEITGYDVESNTNANMLKNLMMMAAAEALPVYFGYRTAEQTATINENIVLGVTDPSQHTELDQSANHDDFPDTVDVHWKDTFPAMDEFTEYTQWLAVPVSVLSDEYAYYQNIDAPFSLGAYNTKGVIESLTVDGNAYKIYKLNPTAPLNYRLSVDGL